MVLILILLNADKQSFLYAIVLGGLVMISGLNVLTRKLPGGDYPGA